LATLPVQERFFKAPVHQNAGDDRIDLVTAHLD
jgi:hypothetical protein